MTEISDLQVGIAGEHLVCADLLLKGYGAFLADQNCPYDVVIEKDGQLIRLQVKATRKARQVPQRVKHTEAYMWHVRRAGKRGARVYKKGEFDLLALVALDCNKIAYCLPSEVKNTIHIRNGNVKENKGYIFDDFTFEGAYKKIL